VTASIGIGLVLILIIALAFLMLKKNRTLVLHSESNPSSAKESAEYMPVILILIISGIIIFGILVTVHRTFNPPNW
jgi:cytochrome b561